MFLVYSELFFKSLNLLLFFSRYVTSNSLRSHGLQPARLLCPWDFPSNNTRVGCLVLLQGIFPDQGSNPCLLNWQVDSLPLSHLGNLKEMSAEFKPKSTVFRVYVCSIFPSVLIPFFLHFFPFCFLHLQRALQVWQYC